MATPALEKSRVNYRFAHAAFSNERAAFLFGVANTTNSGHERLQPGEAQKAQNFLVYADRVLVSLVANGIAAP